VSGGGIDVRDIGPAHKLSSRRKTGTDILADPARLRQLDLTILDNKLSPRSRRLLGVVRPGDGTVRASGSALGALGDDCVRIASLGI
jgi:hypothetical protein